MIIIAVRVPAHLCNNACHHRGDHDHDLVPFHLEEEEEEEEEETTTLTVVAYLHHVMFESERGEAACAEEEAQI